MSLLAAAHRRNAGGGPSYLLSEDWEGSGTPPGWTHSTGDVDPDYTTTVLDGAQSLYVPTPRVATSPDFAPQSELWAYVMFHYLTAPTGASRYALIFRGASNEVCLAFHFGSALSPGARHGSVTGSLGSALSLNTTYHAWLHWVASSGAGDGFAEIFVDTPATRPGSPTATVSTGDATADAVRLELGNSTTGSGNRIFDKLRVSASEIGSNPA